MATTKSKNLTGEKYYKKLKDKDLKVSNELYDNQVKSINRDYDTQVFEQGKAYEDQYRENAVQKEINKRQVAESMANLGLTDSGLNRTQQTAVQLSYGNNKANIDRQRQSGIDSLNYSRRQALDAIEQNRLADNAQIEQGYAEKAAAYDENQKAEAKNMVLSFLEIGAEPPKDMIALSGISDSELNGYRNYYKKALAAAKVASSSKQKNSSGGNMKTTNIINNKNGMLSRDYLGLLENNSVSRVEIEDDDNKKWTEYTDRITGYTTRFPADTNPYTNTVNPDVKNGTFENGVGYQPDNITLDGENQKLKWADTISSTESKLGRNQNVFKTTTKAKGTQYWIWDDSINEYIEVYEEKGNWVPK